jgi:SGNH hydrolase-like domain, acetyltransferase AlgX
MMTRRLILPLGFVILLTCLALAVTWYCFASRELFLVVLKHKCESAGYPTVLTEKNRWLFYKDEYEYCLRRLPENQKAIEDFSNHLDRKGIKLIVVPIPDKIEVYPEKICGFSVANVVVQRAELIRRLSHVGVDVIDLLPAYKRAKKSKELFLPDESHWTQPAIDIAARLIGDRIRQIVPSTTVQVRSYLQKHATIPDFLGDLAEPSVPDSMKAARCYHYTSVMVSDNQPYRDTIDSPVLVIGDSNVYRWEQYGAHICAHIAMMLGYPVTKFAKVGGSVGGPEMLKFESKSFVESRKVIVWIFTSRGLKDAFLPPALP